MAAHFVRQAAATVLLSQRRTSPAAETKPGKAPKSVDYIGETVAQCLKAATLQDDFAINISSETTTCWHKGAALH